MKLGACQICGKRKNWAVRTEGGKIVVECCKQKFIVLPNARQSNRTAKGSLKYYYLLGKYEI